MSGYDRSTTVMHDMQAFTPIGFTCVEISVPGHIHTKIPTITPDLISGYQVWCNCNCCVCRIKIARHAAAHTTRHSIDSETIILMSLSYLQSGMTTTRRSLRYAGSQCNPPRSVLADTSYQRLPIHFT